MSIWTIDEVEIPTNLDAANAGDFIELVDLSNAVQAHESGSTDMYLSRAEALRTCQDRDFQPKRLFAGRVGSRIVARAAYETMTSDTGVAWMNVQVLPAFRRRGIGTALADRMEEIAIGEGRHRLLTGAVSPEAPGERLAAPTGFGSVPLQNGEVQFLRRRGYSLEQVERTSRLPLPHDESELHRQFEDTRRAAGAQFRLHSWAGRTPDRWLADMAELYTAMSVEEPSAGLDTPPNVWTVARVLDRDAKLADSDETWFVTVVEHLPTGRLVGHTILNVPDDITHRIAQGDTLVQPSHRGHRLGLLLKLANLLRLQGLAFRYPAIVTSNAEENRHMLEVNEALGFLPIAYEGAWKKVFR